MSVGQTSIKKDKAVILSWSQGQPVNRSLVDEEETDPDGMVLYVAIKYKRSARKNGKLYYWNGPNIFIQRKKYQ